MGHSFKLTRGKGHAPTSLVLDPVLLTRFKRLLRYPELTLPHTHTHPPHRTKRPGMYGHIIWGSD